MSPLTIILDIAIIVAMLGIIVFWVRRFAVFRGYKDIKSDVLRVAELLKAQPVRHGKDVVVAGYLGWLPTIIRFSKALETPGLHIEMRMPATCSFTVMPKLAGVGEGRVLMRTGNAQLDNRFHLRTDTPLEVRMLLGTAEALESLEKLCCSSQTGVSLKGQAMELSEMTIPAFTGNHVLDHLNAMKNIAERMRDMPGASLIRLTRLPTGGSGWTIRLALAGGLICLIVLLFAQPYNHPAANVNFNPVAEASGVLPADAARLPQLSGWHVAGTNDFSPAAATFLRENALPLSGRLTADFAGRGNPMDSAYLLVNQKGERRVSMLALGSLAYDAVFSRVDAMVRIPNSSLAKIKWKTAPQLSADGDALLVIQNVDDPTSSLVLLIHGTQTFSARPQDFSQIDLALQ